MWVTEYRNVSAVKTSTVKDYTWEFFCQRISRPWVTYGMTKSEFDALPDRYTDEEMQAGQYDHETKQTVKNLAGGAVFGKAVFPEGVTYGRKNEYFPERSALSFDFEGCGADIYERVDNALKNYSYCWYSTFNHNPPNDYRIRVIVPFIHDVDWRLYSVLYVDIANRIGLQGLDKSSITRSQMMLYCVKISDRGVYEYKVNNAEYIDVEKYLNDKYKSSDIEKLTDLLKINWQDWRISLKSILPQRVEKPKQLVLKNSGKRIEIKRKKTKSGAYVQGDVHSCFNAVVGCSELLDLCVEYERVGNRYRYIHSVGAPGVWVSDDDCVAYSHHAASGDPLNKHAYDAFNIYIFFFCKQTDIWQEKLRAAHQYALKHHRDAYGRRFFFYLFWNKFYK